MFVLDTNMVAELRKVRGGKANLGVASWAEQAPTGSRSTARVGAIDLFRHLAVRSY